jgi:hypothetical protein
MAHSHVWHIESRACAGRDHRLSLLRSLPPAALSPGPIGVSEYGALPGLGGLGGLGGFNHLGDAGLAAAAGMQSHLSQVCWAGLDRDDPS